MACLVSSQALTRMSSSVEPQGAHASDPGLLGTHHLGFTGEHTESSFRASLNIPCGLVSNVVSRGPYGK